MNEIERAIEYLEPISKHPIMPGAYCEHLKVAIEALREQAERSKGCEWCIDMDDFDRFEHYRIDREGNAEVHAHMVLANLSRFCPMCGKAVGNEAIR